MATTMAEQSACESCGYLFDADSLVRCTHQSSPALVCEQCHHKISDEAEAAETAARLHAWCNDPRCPEHAYTPTHPRRECPEPELSVPAYWSEPRPDFCPDCGQWARDTRTGTCAFCAVYTTTPLPPAVPYTPTPTTREGHEGRYGWGRRRRARMDRRGVR